MTADRTVVVGVDVGGTFTDLVALDEESRRVWVAKVPSTTGDYSQGFLAGLDRLGVRGPEIGRLLHGTTAATNAAIERRGAQTIGIFTQGFRDTLAIGTSQRFAGGLFDPRFSKPRPLILRSHSLEVRERVDHQGRTLVPLDRDGLPGLVASIRQLGAETVAICLLHSYANDAHEKIVEAYLREQLPDMFVCRSADVHPQIREYERFTATAFNAYLGPIVERYINRLQHALGVRGYGSDLLIMASNGGVISAEHAARYPVKTVLSGPAGGVSAGLLIGRILGLPDLITHDMGGTSTDVCLVKGGRASLATQRIVSGLPLRVPQLDINTIGAGGGSIASVQSDGSFPVGPESAGAIPGPACYGRGGDRPTVTDANVVLNRLADTTLLGGSLQLASDLAAQAVDRIRASLGFADLQRAAEGITRVATSNMAGAIREISVERGEDPRTASLLTFGGAGPMHACDVADELGIRQVIVPLFPGNLAALGLLVSDERHEFVRTYFAKLEESDMEMVRRSFLDLAETGRRALAGTNGRRAVDCDFALELRFVGQAHGLRLQVDPHDLSQDAIDRDFRELYQATWSYRPEGRVQIVNLLVTVVGRAPAIDLRPPTQARASTVQQATKERRDVYFDGRWRPTPVYDRALLPLESQFEGPAIIDEAGGTTVVPPAWRGEVHPTGHLFLWPR